LKEHAFKNTDFLHSCVEEEIKLQHWDRISKFVMFIQTHEQEDLVNKETIQILQNCLNTQKMAALKVLDFFPSQFYLLKDFYGLAVPLLESPDHKFKTLSIILNNVVEIYSMNLEQFDFKSSPFLAFALEQLKKYLTFEDNEELTKNIKVRRRIFLDKENIIVKLGKVFKHNWNHSVFTPDGDKTTTVHKLQVEYAQNYEATQNLTIFDLVYLLGKNRGLMHMVYTEEAEYKNWFSDIYSSGDMVDESREELINNRIRFLEFYTTPLGRFVDQ
jgi:hypothetical protein